MTLTLEIVNFEYTCSAFCGCTLKFWRVDLDEPFSLQRFTEEVGYGCLQHKDAL
jgi:hypothetical protein